jgi:glycosyltransferase involved in cell wall biosynthesis
MHTTAPRATTRSYLFILPVWNEAPVLEKAVGLLLGHLKEHFRNRFASWNVLIADNASTDDTPRLAKVLAAREPHLVYLTLPQKGRGRALKRAVEAYPAEITMYLDIDVPFDPQRIPHFLSPLEKGEADVVLMKRAGARPFHRRVLSWCTRAAALLFLDLPFSDPQVGVKAWNEQGGHVLRECAEEGYFLDTEFLARGKRAGLHIKEQEMEWIEARFPERRSKVRPKDAAAGAWGILRIANRLFPGFARALLFFLGTGIGFAGILIAQQMLLNPFDFQRAGGPLSPDTEQWARYLAHILFPALSIALLLWYLIMLPRVRCIPPRLFLALTVASFFVFSAIAIATAPTESQDIYWNLLLAKGAAVQGLNPYLTTPEMLRGDSWFAPYLNWTNLPMPHGPLWTLLITGLVSLGKTLAVSMLLVKLAALFFLLLSGWLLWNIAKLHAVPFERRNVLLFLLAWNPAVLQSLLTDAHNDFLVVPSILASYLFLKQERYAASALTLLLGGFVKYSPFFLLPIPLFYLLFRNTAPWRDRFLKIAGVALAGIFLTVLLYTPFGGAGTALGGGPANEIFTRGTHEYSLFPTFALATSLGLEIPAIRMVGGLGGMLFMAWFLFRRKPLLAYTHPFLVLFLFGTPWVLPWYFLWILPLLALSLSIPTFIFLSAFLASIPGLLTPLAASYLFASIYIGWKLLSSPELAQRSL